MDQPRKVAKPARDQLNREIKCLKKSVKKSKARRRRQKAATVLPNRTAAT